MEIEDTTFGTITIDGKTYEHDVIIRLSGEVVKRKKKLSKKYYGTSHVLSKDEAKFVFEKGCEQLILGTGLLAGAAMGLLDLQVLTSLGLPILGEGGIDGLIKLSRRVIGNVEDGRAGKHCAPHKERRTDTGAGR